MNSSETTKVGLVPAAAGLMVVCCGGHLVALSLIGGLAAGSVAGIAVGALVAVALIVALIRVRRRRRQPSCPGGPTTHSAAATVGPSTSTERS